MSTTHRFNQVDVFTDKPYYGNALAVVTLNAPVTESDMQRFANWTNLSETTFLSKSEKADYSLKIFTPVAELPFAGHPTLGSAYVYLNSLSQEERDVIVKRGGSLTQECGIGLVQLKWDAASNLLSFQAPPLIRFEEVQSGLLDRVCKGMNISKGDVVDAKWIENGPPWFGVQLKNADKVLEAKLTDTSVVKDLYFGLFGEYADGQSQAKFEVRGFAPLAGDIGEDPVTGSLKWVNCFVGVLG